MLVVFLLSLLTCTCANSTTNLTFTSMPIVSWIKDTILSEVAVVSGTRLPSLLDKQYVVIGSEPINFDDPVHVYGLIPEDSTCANITEDFHVHATGTFFKGHPVSHAVTSNVSVSEVPCGACPAVLVSPYEVQDDSAVYIGGLVQTYDLEVQLMIACFQGHWPPYLGAILGWTLGLLLASYNQHTKACSCSCFQIASAGGLFGEASQRIYQAVQLHALSGSVDNVKLASIVTTLLAGVFVLKSRCSYVHFMPGDSKPKYTVKSMIASAVLFITSASFASASPLAQLARAMANKHLASQPESAIARVDVTYNMRRP